MTTTATTTTTTSITTTATGGTTRTTTTTITTGATTTTTTFVRASQAGALTQRSVLTALSEPALTPLRAPPAPVQALKMEVEDDGPPVLCDSSDSDGLGGASFYCLNMFYKV